jgi:hypothetical protein
VVTVNLRALATALLAVADAVDALEDIPASDPQWDIIARAANNVIADPSLQDVEPFLQQAVVTLDATRCRVDGRRATLT